MPKRTKRSRKFESSGGVQGRLDKGTIAKKKRVKTRHQKDARTAAETAADAKGPSARALMQKRDSDLTSRKNLGDLDLDSFFATFEGEGKEKEEQVDEDVDVDEDEEEEDEQSENNEEEEEGSSDIDEDDDRPAKRTKKVLVQKKVDQVQAESDSDSDEEEDLEAAEQRMAREMEEMEEKDPEFTKFLKEDGDAGLLQYSAEQGGDELDVTHHSTKPILEEQDDSNRLTMKQLRKLEKEAFDQHKLKSLKKIVAAYRSACHMADADDDEKRGGKQSYTIDSPAVFNRLLLTTLRRCHGEMYHHLLGHYASNSKKNADVSEDAQDEGEDGVDENKPILPKHLERCERWSSMNAIIQSVFRSTMHMLSTAKDAELLATVLRLSAPYVPYLSPFPRVAESALKLWTSLWSAAWDDSSEDYQLVRLHAFLRVRQLALTQPFPFVEECLKKMYLAYAQRAKFATAAAVTSLLPTLTFMGNCVVELYSIDFHSSYQHAFVYIRQLALHLRTAMQRKTDEAMGAVYCWQYLHCLKLWTAVLSAACRTDDDGLMRSLLFPLSQVIIGTARLVPSARYLPLRLHCVRLLQQLAASAEVFLPTTSILLDALDLKELQQQPRKATRREQATPLALTFRLHSDHPLRSAEEMEQCVSEVFVLLNHEADLYRYSGGFPEYAVRICQRLRKFVKSTRNSRWKAYAKGTVDLCDRHTKWAVTARAEMEDVAPKDVKQLEVLRPVNVPSMGDRHAAALEKERRLESATRPAVAKQAEKKKEEEEEKKKKPAKKKKSTKSPARSATPAAASNASALSQEDEVEEGINWSDEE